MLPQKTSYLDYYCHWDGLLKRHLVCAEFFFAKVAGEIVPNKGDGCWEIVNSKPRNMSWRAKFIAGAFGNYTDASGDPYSWWDCPFCGGDLPEVTVERPSFPR